MGPATAISPFSLDRDDIRFRQPSLAPAVGRSSDRHLYPRYSRHAHLDLRASGCSMEAGRSQDGKEGTVQMKAQLTSRDWFGKASAGLVLGLAIALGLSGLLAEAMGLKDTYFSLQGQLTMWLMAPVWAIILSFCFLFRSGQRAWAVLSALTAVIWISLYLLGNL